jgi:hypothetical protein
MFLRITTQLSGCKMLVHVLWLLANSTLHCNAVKGLATIGKKCLIEEHDAADL